MIVLFCNHLHVFTSFLKSEDKVIKQEHWICIYFIKIWISIKSPKKQCQEDCHHHVFDTEMQKNSGLWYHLKSEGPTLCSNVQFNSSYKNSRSRSKVEARKACPVMDSSCRPYSRAGLCLLDLHMPRREIYMCR